MEPDSQVLYDILWPVGSVAHALPELPDGVNAVWQRTPYTDRAGIRRVAWTRTDDQPLASVRIDAPN